MGAADHLFDAQKHIAKGLAAVRLGRKVKHRRRRRRGVVCRVKPRPAVQQVRACVPQKKVIAVAARQSIVAGPAPQRVVAKAPRKAVGPAAAIKPVVARTAVQTVRALAPLKPVIAAKPEQQVCPSVTPKRVAKA